MGYDTYTQQTEGAVMVDISRLDVYNADERNGRDEDVLERKYVSRVSGREREGKERGRVRGKGVLARVWRGLDHMYSRKCGL